MEINISLNFEAMVTIIIVSVVALLVIMIIICK
jgi:hypothetical protein